MSHSALFTVDFRLNSRPSNSVPFGSTCSRASSHLSFAKRLVSTALMPGDTWEEIRGRNLEEAM